MEAILNNVFTLPEIPESMILKVDEKNQETLILQIPIINHKGITKYLYLKPPNFIDHIEFQKEFGKLQLYTLHKSGIVGRDVSEYDVKLSLFELIGLMTDDFHLYAKLLKKYLLFKPKIKNACSYRWLIKNANIFQIQRILTYICMLPEVVKKNAIYHARKLGILRHLQTQNVSIIEKLRQRSKSLKPRY